MNHVAHPPFRRWRARARLAVRLATMVCAVMFIAATGALRSSTASQAAALQAAGQVKVISVAVPPADPTPVNGGDSRSEFQLSLPSVGGACPGSAVTTPDYLWQTFFADAGVDVSQLHYGATGPIAVTGHYVRALFDTSDTRLSNQNPSTDPVGVIGSTPTLTFTRYESSPPAQGDYTLGVACSTGGTTAVYWTAVITVTPGANGAFTWSVKSDGRAAVATTTTTIASTSTTSRPTTTTATATTLNNGTSTTLFGSTTTAGGTSSPSSTSVSSAAPLGATTTTSSAGLPFNASGTASNGARLPTSGSNSWPLVIWGGLLLVFGRMAILLGRRPRVLTTKAR